MGNPFTGKLDYLFTSDLSTRTLDDKCFGYFAHWSSGTPRELLRLAVGPWEQYHYGDREEFDR
jgi:hypothetical protein